MMCHKNFYIPYDGIFHIYLRFWKYVEIIYFSFRITHNECSCLADLAYKNHENFMEEKLTSFLGENSQSEITFWNPQISHGILCKCCERSSLSDSGPKVPNTLLQWMEKKRAFAWINVQTSFNSWIPGRASNFLLICFIYTIKLHLSCCSQTMSVHNAVLQSFSWRDYYLSLSMWIYLCFPRS